MQMMYGRVAHKSRTELQLESVWTTLLTLSKLEPHKLAEDPIGIIKEHLITTFDLAVTSASQVAAKVARILEDAGKIQLIYGQKRSIVEIRVLDNNPLLSLSPKSLAATGARPKVHTSDNGIHADLKDMKAQLAKLSQPAQGVQNQTALRGVAIWVDTPNLWKSCRAQGIKIPFAKMFSAIREHLGTILFTGAFHNQNCGEGTLRVFKTHDFALFNCVSAKENHINGYDPVDLEMDRVIRALMNVADTHVIVSGDADFNPLISFLRMNGKNACRFIVDRNSRSAILALNGRHIHVDCEQETNIALLL
jgi:hypothetical protein